MRIRTVDRDPDSPAELKASLEQILPKLAEELASGDYTDMALKRCLADAYAVITFVDPETIREYNREERGMDKVTDCLSFPILNINDGRLIDPESGFDTEFDDDGNPIVNLGDILLNLTAIREQAVEYGHSFEREAGFLAAHSLLHLLGYDHIEKRDEKVMIEKQKSLMVAAGLAFEDEVKDLEEMVDHKAEMSLPAGSECSHCGYVALLGRPNVGKSTLVNYITGMKIAIVSHKPQTTRTNIRSIVNTEDSQIIFVDTPGVHKPDTRMGEIMVDKSFGSAINSDLVLLMADGRFDKPGNVEKRLIELCRENNKKVILAINKDDDVKGNGLLPVIASYAELYDYADVVPISARTGHNVDVLLDVIRKNLPAGPRLFDSEYMTDQTEREIAAELIREQVLHYIDQEVPHGTAVLINKFEERAGDSAVDEYDREIVVIEADIICERESHKAIIIGKGGQMIKRIGSAARRNIERMLGCKVYLDLYVKVRPDWLNNEGFLREYGLNEEDKE